ncbi:MAG: hypothetical protein JRJ84_17355 [Deltaproteobacteria bacterium]|nr:hypothetical protein [Deltaproteobacteria bacterium]
MHRLLFLLPLVSCTFEVSNQVFSDPEDEAADTAASQRCGALTLAAEGTFVRQGDAVQGWRGQCEVAVHASAGAGGSRVSVRLPDWSGQSAARVRVLDLLGQDLHSPAVLEPGESVPVDLVQSGEFFVHLEPVDLDEPGHAYAVGVQCVQGCDLEFTRYPLVLVHGAAPADYVSLFQYFYGVREHLQERGYLVVTPAVDPFASTEQRCAQWSDHLDTLVDDGVGRRFDLIGHSQGGTDARYLTSRLAYGDEVAAVITVAAPHRGSAVADVASGLVDVTPFGQELVDAAVDGLAALLGLPPQDAVGALASLTTEAMADFNATTPDVPGVYYASWAGRSCGVLDLYCQRQTGGEVVAVYLGATFTLLSIAAGDNDGMVPVSSAQWGAYMGEIPADHMDSVGQVVDAVNPVFDHRAFYLSEARRLAALGL